MKWMDKIVFGLAQSDSSLLSKRVEYVSILLLLLLGVGMFVLAGLRFPITIPLEEVSSQSLYVDKQYDSYLKEAGTLTLIKGREKIELTVQRRNTADVTRTVYQLENPGREDHSGFRILLDEKNIYELLLPR